MNDEVVLTWSFTNLVTVLLMIVVGFAAWVAAGFVVAKVRGKMSAKDDQ